MPTCFGGMTVASKMCSRVLKASVSQSSLSSGDSPMPWLGQPCRLVGPFLYPCTSTRYSFRPEPRSPTSKPSKLVDVDEAERLAAVDRERPDARAEGTDASDRLDASRCRRPSGTATSDPAR